VVGDDPYSGAVGRFYSFYIERPRLGRVVGRALWGSDFGPMYRSLDGLRHLRCGASVLDAACGAGIVLRWLDPSRRPRYVGVDSSPAMLERARQVANRRGFSDVQLHLAGVESMPLGDACADVCLLYNALHCFRDPEAALDSVLRCAKPGGLVLGSMLVRGAVARADRLMEADADRGGSTMGAGGTSDDLRRWLEARLVGTEITVGGALAVFRGQSPSD